MPRDERLAETHVLDELGDRRLTLGEPADDPKAVDVGERLVDEADGSELLGLVDDRREGGPDPGGRGTQGDAPRMGDGAAVGSIGVYINMR